jgi:hypothetical protein
MPIGEDLYVRIALEETDETWELHDNWLRCKPGGTFGHNELAHRLLYRLIGRLDRDEHHLRINAGRLALGRGTYLVPDLFVLPVAMFKEAVARHGWEALEVYREPVPLVVEVWEPRSEAFGYDGDRKLSVYRRRGDDEIWRLHPYERTLHGWRKQPDGSYESFLANRGIVELHALPGVTIDLDELFSPRE